MRLKIRFHALPGSILPVQYQWHLARQVQQWLGEAPPDGHPPFSFSRLRLPELRRFRDRYFLLGKRVEMTLGFARDSTAERVLLALLQTREIKIGDRFSQAIFQLKEAVALPAPEPAKIRAYILRSPLLVNEGHPDPETLAQMIGGDTAAHFEWLNQPREELVQLFPGSKDETWCKAWNGKFSLEAAPELHRSLLQEGIGHGTQYGFGHVAPCTPMTA